MPTRCQHRTTLCPSQPLWHPEKKSSRRDSSVGSPCVYGSSQHNQSRRTSFSFFVFNKPPHLIQAFFSTNITRTSAIILQGILSKTARGPRERPTSHDEDLRDLHKQFSCSLSHIICCERGERETRKRRPRKHELSVVSCLVTLRVRSCVSCQSHGVVLFLLCIRLEESRASRSMLWAKAISRTNNKRLANGERRRLLGHVICDLRAE